MYAAKSSSRTGENARFLLYFAPWKTPHFKHVKNRFLKCGYAWKTMLQQYCVFVTLIWTFAFRWRFLFRKHFCFLKIRNNWPIKYKNISHYAVWKKYFLPWKNIWWWQHIFFLYFQTKTCLEVIKVDDML